MSLSSFGWNSMFGSIFPPWKLASCQWQLYMPHSIPGSTEKKKMEHVFSLWSSQLLRWDENPQNYQRKPVRSQAKEEVWSVTERKELGSKSESREVSCFTLASLLLRHRAMEMCVPWSGTLLLVLQLPGPQEAGGAAVVILTLQPLDPRCRNVRLTLYF
jgi:hypothetical protein